MVDQAGIFEKLKDTPLFHKIGYEDFLKMMDCWNAQVKTYLPDETITRSGEADYDFEIVVEGGAFVYQESYFGVRTLLRAKGRGESTTIGTEEFLDDGMHYVIVANGQTMTLVFDGKKVLGACEHPCPFHTQMLANMVVVLRRAHYRMFEHLVHVSKRTTRAKLLSYLSTCQQASHASKFETPFNRQQMADYLCVDRSAMCSELSKMKKAGLIDYDGRWFKIIEHPAEDRLA